MGVGGLGLGGCGVGYMDEAVQAFLCRHCASLEGIICSHWQPPPPSPAVPV